MKKLLRFLPVFLLVFASVSCSDPVAQPADPFDVPNSELTPTAFTLEGQQGNPVIADSSEDPGVGTISVIIEIRQFDVASLTVENIRVPRGATASIARGDVLDLSADAEFTVTAEDGSERVYSVVYSEPARATANSVVTFELDGQVGKTTITDEGEEGGTIEMVLDPDNIADLSAIEIRAISVSDLATTTTLQGSVIDLSDGQTEIIVTSDAGTDRTYTVKSILPIVATDPIGGTFKMFSREVKENWGGTDNAVIVDGDKAGDWYSISDKNWMWGTCGRTKNYTLKILVTEEASGTVSGSAILSAPNDEWFDFVWDPNTDGTDVTAIYQIIPKGVSQFTKNSSTGEITFFVDGEEYGKTVMHGPSDPTGASPVTFTSGSGQVLTLGKTKSLQNGEGTDIASDVYGFLTPRDISNPDAVGDKSIFVDNVRGVLWMVQKL